MQSIASVRVALVLTAVFLLLTSLPWGALGGVDASPQSRGGTTSELSVGPALANVSRWVSDPVTPPNAPPTGGGYAMAYDPDLSAMVAFGGGRSSGQVQNSTWEFAHGTWTNVTSIVGPGPSRRADAQMVDDAADGTLVLFGGLSAGDTFLNDTWIFSAG
ncbi:MAG: kelch motif-containing protein, partial [Thermoplasmata archaeon]|nr:kelch motif-containing protein [Thermoplasmata archaeon]